jgi:hypothetical protein
MFGLDGILGSIFASILTALGQLFTDGILTFLGDLFDSLLPAA